VTGLTFLKCCGASSGDEYSGRRHSCIPRWRFSWRLPVHWRRRGGFRLPNPVREVASVCIGPDGLEYRFGRPQTTERELSAPGPAPWSAFLYSHYYRPRVERSSLKLEASHATYAIFTDIEDSEVGPAGVSVKIKSASRSFEIACSSQPEMHWYGVDGKSACAEDDLNSGQPP